MGGAPMYSGMDRMGGGFMGGINLGGGQGQKMPVKDLAPVHVTA